MRRERADPAAAPAGPLSRDPEIMGGEAVFAGTRVPARILLDYLDGGYGLEAFLDDFPTVTREQAAGALALLRDALPALAGPAR